MKFEDVARVIREEKLACWTLYKVDGYSVNRVATNWLSFDKGEPREQAIDESIEKLKVRVSFDPLATYEIVIKEETRTPDKYAFKYRFSDAEPKTGSTTTTPQEGFSGFGSIYDKLADSKISEERTRFETQLEKQDLNFRILMREQELNRREARLKAGFKRLKTLKTQYESESERISNAIGLAGTKLIEHFGIGKDAGIGSLQQQGEQAPQSSPQEQIIESLATELFNRNLPTSELQIIGKIVNTYLQNPNHVVFNPFKNEFHKEKGNG